ncbi:hypothetical protein ACQI4F_24865 [Mycolicibacterium vaccae]|uniref:hypothetical protein n=1 Tax=Mycolicibacterium vaccae TaxID=1810 RepID=UPI003CEBEC74
MRRRAAAELFVAVLVAVGAVLAWISASTQVVVAPLVEGEPATVSRVYSAPMLTLSLLLATVAGVLAVYGVTHLVRRPAPDPPNG